MADFRANSRFCRLIRPKIPIFLNCMPNHAEVPPHLTPNFTSGRLLQVSNFVFNSFKVVLFYFLLYFVRTGSPHFFVELQTFSCVAITSVYVLFEDGRLAALQIRVFFAHESKNCRLRKFRLVWFGLQMHISFDRR